LPRKYFQIRIGDGFGHPWLRQRHVAYHNLYISTRLVHCG